MYQMMKERRQKKDAHHLTRLANEEALFFITTAEHDKIHTKGNNVVLKVPLVRLNSGWFTLHSI